MIRMELAEHICEFLPPDFKCGKTANQILGFLMVRGFNPPLEDLVDTLMDGLRCGMLAYGEFGYYLCSRETAERLYLERGWIWFDREL